MNHTAETIDMPQQESEQVTMQVVEINQEQFYKIQNCHLMRPFMMNIVSDSNHWMFAMSNGGVTAGRKNVEYALFPYYTDDKLAELADLTGSKTIFQINKGHETYVWEPFSDRFTAKYTIRRNLYKNKSGNKVIFEEINHDLSLTFSYEWNTSKLYGFVKKSKLSNHSDQSYNIVVLDGLQNIMPYGVSSLLQNSTSNLADAYKRNEIHPPSGLGIYSLSAFIVDKAEPSESLKANVVWCTGLKADLHLLSSLQLDAFRHQKTLKNETDVKGEKGAYFVQSTIQLHQDEMRHWHTVANVNQDHYGIAALIRFIVENKSIEEHLLQDIDRGTHNLIADIAAADGMQYTADPLQDARHFSNVLFNIMRGGIFDHHYFFDKKDFVHYLKKANATLPQTHQSFSDQLPDTFDKKDLEQWLHKSNDQDLMRLSKEYLPLRFSRRHGDPSRPWNKFTINTHNEIDGSKILDYEGNWRDIFQNWEALAHSYPEFIEGMIFKFLNASTFDGYNPYRITKDGFDWEVIEPDNPWSYIGYWGDHQIIYLLKFLEFASDRNSALLPALFGKDYFVYANVPYRIKPYADLLKDSKNTIEFDEEADLLIRSKVNEIGSDGALLGCRNSEIYRVNLLEKLLATVLSKTSNFIPEAGIWMNTQRPEWNDANNALVGNGVSMVTLCYLRRFLCYFEQLLENHTHTQCSISEELLEFFHDISHALDAHKNLLQKGFNAVQRKKLTDELGTAGSTYREKIYQLGFSGQKAIINLKDVLQFVKTAITYFEQTIRVNKRTNQLYNAYNLLIIEKEAFKIEALGEMLEGQVAAISSGLLSVDEVVTLLDALRNSSLYRADQNSYLLYPNKDLPGFMEKNTIPAALAEKSELFKKLIALGDRSIITRDINGEYHFNGNFHNAEDLKQALQELEETSFATLAKKEKELTLEIFEQVFNHKSFTGRSGTFFAYEGLGSIYWHMVSKLYLAVGEVCVKASQRSTSPSTMHKLLTQFREIGEGIGVHKSPAHYGAYPTDAYSHTPWHRGAQQPGMTGQVKEDILTRIAELGIRLQNGKLTFEPQLLQTADFIKEATMGYFVDVNGLPQHIPLSKGMLAFSYCQIPVVYELGEEEKLHVHYTDGKLVTHRSLTMDEESSNAIFTRGGTISKIHAIIPTSCLSA